MAVDASGVDEAPELAEFKLGYRPALDGIRALAIVMVMWHHTVAILFSARGRPLGGFLGVDVFFVLSGFLITSLLVERRSKHGRIDFGDFYRRRARRLLPALFALLAVNYIVARTLGHNMILERRSVIGAITYTTNWAPTFHIKLADDLPHLWSLAIEEQFYLVWPLLIALLLRWKPRVMLWWLAASILAVVVWRIGLLHHYVKGYPIVYQRTDARADGLLVGALIAVALHAGWRPSNRLRQAAGWVGLPILAWYFWNANSADRDLYLGGYTLVAFAAAGLILAALDGPGPLHRMLSFGPAVRLGRISYSLYLWHVVAFELVSAVVHGPSAVRLPVAYGVAIGVAWLSYTFIEQPFLDRRSSRSEPSVQPAPMRRRIPLALASAGATVTVFAGVGAYVASISK